MTSPTVTVKAGAQPILLTPYAPGGGQALEIINANVSGGRVYLGADGTVSAANGGVPLDPGTSLEWTEAGQVWAVADAANTVPVTLTVSSTVEGWQPSPVAIAAQVAAQLLATGVPNVLKQTIIAAGVTVNATSQGLAYDISGYASIIVLVSPQVGQALTVQFWQSAGDANNTTVDSEYFIGNASGTPIPLFCAVRGKQFTLYNWTANKVTLTLIGSNRPINERLDTRSNYNSGDDWTLSTDLTSGGTLNTLGQTDATIKLQGQAWAAFSVTPATVAGRFELWYNNNSAAPVILCDTAEMTTTASGGLKVKDKLIALPATSYTVRFRSSAAVAGASLAAHLIPGTV